MSDHVTVLRGLVGHDTTSSLGTRALADHVCATLERPGVVIDRHIGSAGEDTAEKVSVIARVGPDCDGEAGLVLCGHLDVVPALEPEWTGDPFELREDGDRLLGRGACDMKGFIAVAMSVFGEVDSASLRHPLVLLLTCDEELGSLGAQHLVSHWAGAATLPRQIVIGEPTSLRVVRLHKGHLKLRITSRGIAAHSGTPQLGRTAVEPAAELIVALGALSRALGDERRETSPAFPETPSPALTVVRVRGGEAWNVVPDACVIDLSIRTLPGDDGNDYIDRVRSVVDDVATRSGGDFEIVVIGDNPPLLGDRASRVSRWLLERVEQTDDPGVSYASDGGVLSRDLDRQCVLFGPGCMSVAHKPDEWISRAELDRAGEILREMVREFCT